MTASAPSTESLAPFARFAAAFEAPDFCAGEWGGGEEVEPGVQTLPWWSPSRVVLEWHQALYDHDIMDPQSDYLSEDFAVKMREFAADPSTLAEADLPTVRTVMTNISRGDRFCEGYMAEMFENGVAQAASTRLAEFASETERRASE